MAGCCAGEPGGIQQDKVAYIRAYGDGGGIGVGLSEVLTTADGEASTRSMSFSLNILRIEQVMRYRVTTLAHVIGSGKTKHPRRRSMAGGVIVYAKEQGSLKLPSSACLADDLYTLTEQGDNHDTDKFLHEWVHCSESG